jgi:hypothetical protein
MKSKLLMALLFLIGLLSGCEKLLDLDHPNNQLSSELVFNSDETAKAALDYIYSNLRDNGILSGQLKGGSILLGLYTDELVNASSDLELLQVSSLTHNAKNSSFSTLWNKSYEQLYAINLFIEKVEKSKGMSKAQSAQMLGECYTLRALLYLHLNQLFGEIPYIKSTDYRVNKKVSRTQQIDINQSLLSDLQQALDYFDLSPSLETKDPSRIHKFATYMVLAKFYLLQEDWENARFYSNEIINAPSFDLNQDIQMEFKKESKGTIWHFLPSNTTGNTFIAQVFIPTAYPSTSVVLNEALLDRFEARDLRKTYWTQSVRKDSLQHTFPYKYQVKGNTAATLECLIVFRLAEVYLIRAEAHAQLGRLEEALEDLNAIKIRAGLPQLTETEDLVNAIINERSLELFAEFGNRFYDLKRSNQWHQLKPIKSNLQDFHVFFPIPENELLLNINLQPQNNGY